MFPLGLSKRRNISKHREAEIELDGVFTPDRDSKKPSKEEEKRIQDLSLKLVNIGLVGVPNARIEYVLKVCDGDAEDAFSLLRLYQDSVAGIVRKHDPSVNLLGAVNREKVTCYLDALLFAMFARREVFEAMLFNNFDDKPRRRLVTIIRLWVNMLRTGRLITTDITRQLQESLAACGWKEAAELEQQDASEAFGVITDKLDLPLLTLRTDIFHAGIEEASDDHKFITERLLDVAIPEDTQDNTTTLERCLEDYFNNRVEVKRELERRHTNTLPRLPDRKSSIEKSDAVFVENAGVNSSSDALATNGQADAPLQRPNLLRDRATSIFSDRNLQLSEEEKSREPGLARVSSMRKEVLMPAWQFLNLIPFYTGERAPDRARTQVAEHFSEKRPVLGICLKRYRMETNGKMSRLSTHVDVPLEMAPPHFADDIGVGDEPSTEKYKLSLQSVVCHRGSSVNSGHYIALIRVEASQRDRHEAFGDTRTAVREDGSHDTWLCMDDTASKRVAEVDIHKALAAESPYLLFYRVQPVDKNSDAEEPPPYSEPADSFATVDQKLACIAEDRGRRSTEGEWQLRRTSIAIAGGDSTSGRPSLSEHRRGSSRHVSDASKAPSLATNGQTSPSTPGEEPKEFGDETSRVSSKGPRPARTSFEGAKFMSKITSRLSRDKLNGPDVVVSEIKPDSNDMKNGNEDGSDGTRLKGKETKSKFKSGMSRGSSIGRSKKGRPDRECAVM